jgi:hypothetical protein
MHRVRSRLGHAPQSLATSALASSGLDHAPLCEPATSCRQLGLGITPRAGTAG